MIKEILICNLYKIYFQAGEDQGLSVKERNKICDVAKSMIKLFPRSKFGLEFLGKYFLHSLASTRKVLCFRLVNTGNKIECGIEGMLRKL